MDNIMIENEILKLKIIRLEKEYLNKMKIKNPSSQEIIKMRCSINNKLKTESKKIGDMHNKITNFSMSSYKNPFIE